MLISPRSHETCAPISTSIFKRQIVNPRDVDGLLTANTAPWQTIEEFEEARDGLEAWKKSTRSVLKTAADYKP